jgi:hypothetical protein
MVNSIVRPAMILALMAGLVGCETRSLLPVEPDGQVTAVITASVMADVAETVADADGRLLTMLEDVAYRAELSAVLTQLKGHIAARDVESAWVALTRARDLVDRPATTVETEDFAADLAAIGFVLDQSEVLLNAASGRTS